MSELPIIYSGPFTPGRHFLRYVRLLLAHTVLIVLLGALALQRGTAFSGQFPYSRPRAEAPEDASVTPDVLAWALSRVGFLASVNGGSGWELVLGWQRMIGEDIATWCVHRAARALAASCPSANSLSRLCVPRRVRQGVYRGGSPHSRSCSRQAHPPVRRPLSTSAFPSPLARPGCLTVPAVAFIAGTGCFRSPKLDKLQWGHRQTPRSQLDSSPRAPTTHRRCDGEHTVRSWMLRRTVSCPPAVEAWAPAQRPQWSSLRGYR